MAKKEEVVEKEEKVNQPDNAPVVSESITPIPAETLSHQWQENSAAINTNVLTPSQASGDNIMDKIETKENIKARQDAADAQAEQWANQDEYSGDCSKLDVSDARYCQPGSERHKAYLKKAK